MVKRVMPITPVRVGNCYLMIVAADERHQPEGNETMSYTVKPAVATGAVALIAAVGSKAQEVDYDPAQTADFTKTVSIELNTEVTAPTADLEAKFAELGETGSIKPDMRYANADQETEEQPVRIAANR